MGLYYTRCGVVAVGAVNAAASQKVASTHEYNFILGSKIPIGIIRASVLPCVKKMEPCMKKMVLNIHYQSHQE